MLRIVGKEVREIAGTDRMGLLGQWKNLGFILWEFGAIEGFPAEARNDLTCIFKELLWLFNSDQATGEWGLGEGQEQKQGGLMLKDHQNHPIMRCQWVNIVVDAKKLDSGYNVKI